MTVDTIEFVDYGVYGEYGLFGKIVARLDVTGMTESEKTFEVAEMLCTLGNHVGVVRVETVAGLTRTEGL
jgi:hypothetical protein